MAETHPLVLIDLSSIVHPTFHQSGSEPDPNWTSIQTVARIRALASGQPHVGICVDGPRSRAIRTAIDPTYKAQRDSAPEALFHQIRLVIETLKSDGFPVWQAEGYEADDVIASAMMKCYAPHLDEWKCDVLIVSADKDLLALVGPHVHAKSLKDGSIIDEAAVVAKFGVKPSQIPDYLALVGDASDNIKGAKGIGDVKARTLLSRFGSLDKLMTPEALEGLTPALRESLQEFAIRCDTVRQLIALRTDVPVNIAEAFVTRVPQGAQLESEMAETDTTSEAAPLATTGEPREPESRVDRAADTSVDKANTPAQDEVNRAIRARRETEAAARAQESERAVLIPQVMPAPAPAEWTMQLEPRSMADARQLAADLHASRLFSAYGSPAAVLSTILAGRELGLQAMASLRAFHIIEGKPTLSAGIIQAMTVKADACEYFRCTERSATAACFETKRRENPPMTLRYTIEEAQAAGLVKAGSGWAKNPADMLVARAASKLARLVYPDVVGGLYAPEEF